MPVQGGLGQQVQKVVKLNNGSGGLITQANKPCMLSEEQVQLLYIVSPGGTNHQKQRYENMAYPSGYDMEWVQFLIQWPQQPMREPMLLLRTQWFGRVSTLHIYISHIEIRVKFRGETQGVEELHTDELPHPPTLGTKQRWAKHHYQFTKNNQKTQTRSHQSTLLFTSSHLFFGD